MRVEVFTVTGQRVRTLKDGVEEPGTYTIAFGLEAQGARPLHAGVYWVRVTAGKETRSIRVAALE